MALSVSQLEVLYKKTLLVRLCEQQIMSEYFQDEMKTPVHLGIGGEALVSAVHEALPKDTQYFGTYRNHAIYLATTDDTDSFFGEMYGKVTGCAKGKAGSMHMSAPDQGLVATSAVVGTTIPVAVGAALASQYLGKNQITCCFFGDGAVEEGVFYESMNYASLKKLPVLFVCEDNDLAIHSFRKDREGFKSFEKLVDAFNCEFEEGDGSNAVEVFEKTASIIERMQKNQRPGFIHLKYFRFLEHVGPLEDFDKGYRAKLDDVFYAWDPIIKLESAMKAAGISEQSMQVTREELLKRIAKSVAAAKAAPFATPQELYRDVYINQNEGH